MNVEIHFIASSISVIARATIAVDQQCMIDMAVVDKKHARDGLVICG